MAVNVTPGWTAGLGRTLPWSRSSQQYDPEQLRVRNAQFGDITQRLAGLNPQTDIAARMGQFGPPTQMTPIERNPPYSPEMYQANINQREAAGIQRTKGQQTTNRNQAATGGFQTSSPILAELNQRVRQGNYQTTVGDITNFRTGADTANSAYDFAVQGLQFNQDIAGLEELLKRQSMSVVQQQNEMQQLLGLYAAQNQNLRPQLQSQGGTGIVKEIARRLS